MFQYWRILLAHWVFADDDCSFALRGSGARMLFTVGWSVCSPSWMVDARLCADTAKTALPHSVDLVLVRFFPGTYHCCHQFFAVGAKRLRCAENVVHPSTQMQLFVPGVPSDTINNLRGQCPPFFTQEQADSCGVKFLDTFR